MQDSIQKEITVQASAEKVYEAIANPDLVVKWFPETLEGDYSPGSQPIFGFGDHGKSQIYVVAAEPNSYFAYRWVPGAKLFQGDVLSVANTLVEFHINEISEDVCQVKLTESGFKNLPSKDMEDAIKQNTGGWDFMLNRLSEYFNNDA